LRTGADGGWDISLWIKNAFDRRVVNGVYKRWSGALPDGTPIADFDMVTTNFPRQVGLTASYRFE
jgi:outer membrane receptor protein involved in Fe transport